MPKYKENKPSADILMFSMRSIGYTFEAAIADVIDNSISAGARKIEIKFPIEPSDCYIAVCDNGWGMSPEELFDAMKYGSEYKKDFRPADDLGRFGLGMKAASLSQCRKLTVLSKKKGKISALSWDLDVIEKGKEAFKNIEWVISEYDETEIKGIRFFKYLDAVDSGTVVCWEHFDFLEKSSGSVFHELTKLQLPTEKYLSLIFHRFLNREKPNKIEILINNRSLEGQDPFLEKHKKTNPRREITIPVKDSNNIERLVFVQPFILPFQKDITKEDIKHLGGIEDYRTKQGFYIYRNDRLIIWGTWFGRPKGELTKNARVKVDIPNTLDDIWGLDIKKQNATIPKTIKNQLTKAVDEAMDIAVKAQTYRGRIDKVDESVDYIWNRIEERDNSYVYRINRESKIFELIKENIDDAAWYKLDMVMEEIENSVPYQQIYIDKSQNKVIDEIDQSRSPDVEAKAKILLSLSIQLGNTYEDSLEKLFQSEPFNKYPNIKSKLQQEGA